VVSLSNEAAIAPPRCFLQTRKRAQAHSITVQPYRASRASQHVAFVGALKALTSSKAGFSMPNSVEVMRKPLHAAFLLALILMPLAGVAATAQQQPATQAASSEATLRARVQQFYALLQMRQIARAETYATKDSRERLRDQTQNPFLGFKVGTVLVEPDGKSGKVSVELTVMAPYAGAPMPFERKSDWTLEDGEWRIIVPAPPPEMSLDAMMGMAPDNDAPKPEELQFQGHRYGLGVMKAGERKTAAFPFKNISNHNVTMSRIDTGCDCLKVKTQQMTYKPGESGELTIEFDSTGFGYDYAQSVVVHTEPGDVKSYLQIHCEVVPKITATSPEPGAMEKN
jgi:uncharacterized protein DUF1573